MPARRRPQARSVFVNCPFDQDYKDLFNALVFAVHDCGFYVRCALEIETGELRFKICDLIRACRYGIHGLSRTQVDPVNRVPRFNMPLELGLFLGAREFGPPGRPQKVYLVLDTEQFRYQQFCSDLAGVDIVAHANQPRGIVHAIRNRLRANSGGRSWRAEPEILPGGDAIFGRYEQFLNALPDICKDRRLGRDYRTLPFPDYVDLVEGWLLDQGWRRQNTPQFGQHLFPVKKRYRFDRRLLASAGLFRPLLAIISMPLPLEGGLVPAGNRTRI